MILLLCLLFIWFKYIVWFFNFFFFSSFGMFVVNIFGFNLSLIDFFFWLVLLVNVLFLDYGLR